MQVLCLQICVSLAQSSAIIIVLGHSKICRWCWEFCGHGSQSSEYIQRRNASWSTSSGNHIHSVLPSSTKRLLLAFASKVPWKQGISYTILQH